MHGIKFAPVVVEAPQTFCMCLLQRYICPAHMLFKDEDHFLAFFHGQLMLQPIIIDDFPVIVDLNAGHAESLYEILFQLLMRQMQCKCQLIHFISAGFTSFGDAAPGTNGSRRSNITIF